MEQNSISSDLIRGHIDTIILQSLSNNDMFAQQISDYIEQKSNNEYAMNQATLRSALKRLEECKLLSSYLKDIDDGLGRRKFYHLTESGKSTIEKNIANWSYSKSIIDNLVDITPTEKVVERIKYVTIEEKNPTPEHNAQPVLVNENITINNQTNEINKEKNEKNDVNFRVILSSLFNYRKKVDTIEENKEDIIADNLNIPTNESLNEKNMSDSSATTDNLNQTIFQEAKLYSINKSINFADMKLAAKEEGYKLRISSKDSALSGGLLKINLLNFISSFIVLLFCAVQFIPTLVKYNSIINSTALNIIIFFTIISLPFIFFTTKFIIKGNKKINKKLSGDGILVCSIIVFNLLVITLAYLFLANINVNIISNFIKHLYMPLMLMLDAIIFMVIRFFLSKCSALSSKK